MNSWKIILAILMIFGAGALTGSLLVNYTKPAPAKEVPLTTVEEASHPQANGRGHDPSRPSDLPRPRPPEILGKQFVQQLDKTLRLTPEQRAAVAKIVADGQEHNREIWTNVAPQMHKVLQDVRQQIREQLTPEQRKQFEDMLKRFRPAAHHPQTLPNSPLPTNEPPATPPANPAPDA
jgi:uncharacterized membrane protein